VNKILPTYIGNTEPEDLSIVLDQCASSLAAVQRDMANVIDDESAFKLLCSDMDGVLSVIKTALECVDTYGDRFKMMKTPEPGETFSPMDMLTGVAHFRVMSMLEMKAAKAVVYRITCGKKGGLIPSKEKLAEQELTIWTDEPVTMPVVAEV